MSESRVISNRMFVTHQSTDPDTVALNGHYERLIRGLGGMITGGMVVNTGPGGVPSGSIALNDRKISDQCGRVIASVWSAWFMQMYPELAEYSKWEASVVVYSKDPCIVESAWIGTCPEDRYRIVESDEEPDPVVQDEEPVSGELIIPDAEIVESDDAMDLRIPDFNPNLWTKLGLSRVIFPMIIYQDKGEVTVRVPTDPEKYQFMDQLNQPVITGGWINEDQAAAICKASGLPLDQAIPQVVDYMMRSVWSIMSGLNSAVKQFNVHHPKVNFIPSPDFGETGDDVKQFQFIFQHGAFRSSVELYAELVKTTERLVPRAPGNYEGSGLLSGGYLTKANLRMVYDRLATLTLVMRVYLEDVMDGIVMARVDHEDAVGVADLCLLVADKLSVEHPGRALYWDTVNARAEFQKNGKEVTFKMVGSEQGLDSMIDTLCNMVVSGISTK